MRTSCQKYLPENTIENQTQNLILWMVSSYQWNSQPSILSHKKVKREKMSPQELERELLGRFEWFRVLKPVTLRNFLSGEAPSALLSEETPASCKALVMITVSLQREGDSLAISTISHHLQTWRISYLESVPSKSKLGKCNVKPKNQRLKHQRTCKILLIVFMNEWREEHMHWNMF